MSVTVKQKFIHMAPRKLRLVADSVRGKAADAAYASLTIMPRAAAKPVMHAIKSAVAAAKQQDLGTSLVISAVFVDEGPALKRRIFRSRGRATRMEHRMSHLTLTVTPAQAKVKPAKKAPQNTAEDKE
ncbi:MAG TPA: 50S ribosomal protein L22 [Patescibacteria group bacterium]